MWWWTNITSIGKWESQPCAHMTQPATRANKNSSCRKPSEALEAHWKPCKISTSITFYESSKNPRRIKTETITRCALSSGWPHLRAISSQSNFANIIGKSHVVSTQFRPNNSCYWGFFMTFLRLQTCSRSQYPRSGSRKGHLQMKIQRLVACTAINTHQ